MRPIDADKLIAEMRKWYWDEEKQKAAEKDISPMDLFTNLAITIVKQQPTAFDVEKVLNELKHEESEALRRYSESKGTAYAFSDKCSCDNWAKAIEIVKRGGRDERQ